MEFITTHPLFTDTITERLNLLRNYLIDYLNAKITLTVTQLVT